MKKLTGTIKTTGTLPGDLPSTFKLEVPQLKSQSLVNILTTMKNKDGGPLITYEQSLALTSLKFQNGDLILSLEYRPFVYEVVNMLNSLDYEIVYNFLSIDWERLFGSYNIRDKIIFDNPLLKSQHDKMELDMEIYRGGVEISVGSMDCKKCGSSETLSVESQTRGADEPMTVKFTCLQCKNKWTTEG